MISAVRYFCLLATVFAAAPDTLQLVNVLYRHGDRSPVAMYPNDPYSDVWPQGPGWLTSVGMRQQYGLGQFLRSEYGNLLSPSYKNSEILVAASNVDRCLMSAYCNLAGLYPPQGGQVWNPSLLWQPIPVHTRPEDEDHVLAIDEECPLYNVLYGKELHSPFVERKERANAALFKFVEEQTGIQNVNISDVWLVADALFCEKTHNYTLPAWTQRQWDGATVYDKLREISEWSFGLLYNGTQLSRLKGGPLVKVFIKNMQKAAAQKTHYKMYMYSAHDSTVAAVADALKVFNQLIPPYATALLVELHRVGNDYCVKIRYRNETTHLPYTLVNPDCQLECCPLNDFVNVTKSRVPVDWKAECWDDAEGLEISTIVVVTVIVIIVVVLVTLGLYVSIRRCRGTSEEYSTLLS